MQYDESLTWVTRHVPAVTLTEEELNLLPRSTVLQFDHPEGFTIRATSQGNGTWKLHRTPVKSADLEGLSARECLLVPIR